MVKVSPSTYMLVGGKKFPNDVWMLDWSSSTWTQKQNLSVGRAQMACFLHKFGNGSQVVFAVGELSGSHSECHIVLTMLLVAEPHRLKL